MDEITSPIYVGKWTPNPLAPRDITRGQGLFGGQGGLQNQLEMQGVDASALYRVGSEFVGSQNQGSGSVDIMPGQFFPGQVDYGTIPSDLLIDTKKQREVFVDFYNQFGDKLGGKGETVGRWMDVLGQYVVGDAELSDLEAVDVSDLMDIEGFEDYYYGIVPRPLTEDTTTTSVVDTGGTTDISDEEAISSVLASVPDKLKGIFTEQNIMKVLKSVMDEPLTKIKKAQGAGVSTDELFEGWENWKVFGPLAIPGVPLPPGIFEVTLEEIVKAAEQAKQSVGDFVNGILTDPEKTLEDLGKGIKDIVTGVFGGTIKDPGFGGTIGGFGDWIKGILGNSIGGLVFSGIYDFVDGVFNSSETSIPVVGGTKEDEEETTGDPTTRFAQLLGTTEDNLAVDSDLFGTADITADDDTTPGGDITKDITNLLGGTIAQLDTTPVVDTTVGGTATGDDITKTITTLLGGTINQLDTTPVVDTTPGGTTTTDIGGGTTTTDIGGGTTTTDINGGTTTTDIGGYVDPENPPPIVIDPGGVVDPESSGGGGGAVGGTEGMFDEAMRGLSYMPQVLPGVRQPPPLDAMGSLNMLIDGLLTGRRA